MQATTAVQVNKVQDKVAELKTFAKKVLQLLQANIMTQMHRINALGRMAAAGWFASAVPLTAPSTTTISPADA